MATIVKLFSFSADTESFFPSTSPANFNMAYDSGRGIPSGSLRTEYNNSTSGNHIGNGYWTWNGTWQDFGVPSGNVVKQVTLSQIYTSGNILISSGLSTGEAGGFGIAANPIGAGPFEVYQSGGSLQSSLWDGRTILWTDTSWVASSGTTQDIPMAIQGYRAPLEFRLNNGIIYPGSGLLSVNEDQIQLSIDHFPLFNASGNIILPNPTFDAGTSTSQSIYSGSGNITLPSPGLSSTYVPVSVIGHMSHLQFPTTNCPLPGTEINWSDEQADGLVAIWPLWDGGSYAEELITGRASSVRGAIFHGDDDNLDYALEFNGQNDYIEFDSSYFNYENDGESDDYVVGFSVWFKGSGAILGQKGVENDYIPALYVGTDGFLYGSMFDFSGQRPAPIEEDFNDGRFHHVYITYYNNVQRIYVDGKLRQTTSNLSQNVYSDTFTYTIGTAYTGGWEAGNNSWFNFIGMISQPRIYRSKKTQREVRDLANPRKRWNLFKTPEHRTFFDGVLPNFGRGSITLTQPQLYGSGNIQVNPSIFAGSGNIVLTQPGISSTGTNPTFYGSGTIPMNIPLLMGSGTTFNRLTSIPYLPLFIKGVFPGDIGSTLNLFIKGKMNSIATKSRPTDLSSSPNALPLYIFGRRQCVAINSPFSLDFSRDFSLGLVNCGPEFGKSLNLFIHGISESGLSGNTLNLFIQGKNASIANSLPLFISSKDQAIAQTLYLYIKGAGRNPGWQVSTSSLNLYMQGSSGGTISEGTQQDVLALFIEGRPAPIYTSFNNVLPLYINGQTYSINNTVNLFASGIVPSKLTGTLNLVLPKTLFNNTLPLYILGY